MSKLREPCFAVAAASEGSSGATGPAAGPPAARGGCFYRAALAAAALAAAVVVYFFLVGLGDGSVSSFNAGLWLGVLVGVAGVLVAGTWLRARGHTAAALAVLGILVVPGLLYALFLLLILLTNPRWN
jgi:hypothetical protein